MPQAIGIDLGTTNSCAARIDPSGRSKMITNAEGDLLTPSVVLFEESEVIVGKEARSATAVKTDRVAEWVKREMGAAVYSRPIRGQQLPPEVIQSCILRKLRADLTSAVGSDIQVVITVPAYFDEPRRKGTADAGEMAGLAVLDIVNEPTAAALAFGERLGYLDPAGSPKQKLNVLVYDLGGGTFDVTLVEIAPGEIRAIATDGDVQLGGYDWDMRLVEHAAAQFQQTHGLDPRDDPASMSRLYSAVVEAKHTLSARSRANLRVDHAGKSCRIELTREQFEDLTADLLERTAYTTRQLVATAGIEWKDVSRVLLVGGSTRMPMVSVMLHRLSGMIPDRMVNPDEAVARGAAVYANYLLATRGEVPAPATFAVTDVNAHSLGVEGIDQATMRKTNIKLIDRNTPLPARATKEFVTKRDGQKTIAIVVLEGESSQPDDCTVIGRTAVDGLPDHLPKGWPVEVTFEYAANGRLSVRAVVPGTHRDTTLELERTGRLSPEGVARWKQVLAGVDAGAAGDRFDQNLPGVTVLEDEPPGPPPAEPMTPTDRPPPAPPPGSGKGIEVIEDGAPPVATGNGMAGADSAVGDERAVVAPPRRKARRVPRWVIFLIGWITSAAAGIGLAYLALHWYRPESFPLPW